MSGLAPVDADMFWHSRHRVCDQFALYCFAAQPDSDRASVESELRARSAAVDDLNVRIARARGDLAFPRWVRRSGPVPIIGHRGPIGWDDCTRLVAAALTEGLDPTVTASRIHLIGPVDGAPRTAGPAWVVVLQVAHALADGRGVADLARGLFGGAGDRPEPVVTGRPPNGVDVAIGAVAAPIRLAAGLALGLRAWHGAARGSGANAPTAPAAVPATALNRAPGNRRRVDLMVFDKTRMRVHGHPVTVSVLARLAEPLRAYLVAAAGGGASSVASCAATVELTVGRPAAGPADRARNNFHNITVDLRPDLPFGERAASIAAQISAAADRDRHAERAAQHRAAAVTPPVLRALAARLTHADKQGPGARPAGLVAGALVVSSVNRGPSDVLLAGAPAVFTAGFPALSGVHLASVGVHGLGDTVTVSLTTDPDRVDADGLLRVLNAGLGRTVE